MIQKARGIILKRTTVKESDVLLEVLTAEGDLLQLYHHGILATRRRSLLAIEPGSLVEIDYSGNADQPASIRNTFVEHRFDGAKNSYDSLLLVSVLLDLIRFSSRGEKAPGFFSLLQGALKELDETEGSSKSGFPEGVPGWIQENHGFLLLTFFKIRLMHLSGILGDPGHCESCGRALEKTAHWKREEISFLCPVCSSGADRRDGQAARILGATLKKRFRDFLGAWTESQRNDLMLFSYIHHRLDPALETYLGKTPGSQKELYLKIWKDRSLDGISNGK